MKSHLYYFIIIIVIITIKSLSVIHSYIDHHMFLNILFMGLFVAYIFQTYAMPYLEDLVDRQWIFPEEWRVERNNEDLDDKLFIFYERLYKVAFMLVLIAVTFNVMLYSFLWLQDFSLLVITLLLEIYFTDTNS